MKKLSLAFRSEKTVFKVSIFLFILSSIFSTGFHHADEHFQILEFAGSKLGITPIEELPWEYEAGIRPTIQPTMVVGIYKLFDFLGIASPFSVTFFLRLLSAALSFASMLLLYRVLKDKITNPVLQKWFLWLSFILWFALYNGVRFSSENWSGATFIIAFSLYFLKKNKTLFSWLGLGFLFGLSFTFRFQSAIFVAGFMAWMLFIDKQKISHLSVILLGILSAIGIGILIDTWFYGEFTLSFWNYFDINLLQHKASSFGVDPWYYYFSNFFLNAIPPFSLLFIVATIGFVFLKPKNPITWVIVPFLLIHFFISHKELRFLFPMVGFMPFVVIAFIQHVNSKKGKVISNKIAKIFMTLFFIVNFIISLVVSFRSVNHRVSLFEAVYTKHNSPSIMYFFDDTPYGNDLNIYFYKSKNLALVEIKSLEEIPKNQKHSLVIFNNSKRPKVLPKNFKNIYSTYPDWIKLFNINHWVERAGGWTVYEITAMN